MNPSSSNSRGRVSKGRHCTTMANGDTTNRTTSNKFNKNNNQDATTTSVNHSTNTNTASNRVNSSNSAEKVTSGPGGRIRRRSAPPVALEGTGELNNQQNQQNHYYYRSPHHHHRTSGIRSVLKSKSKEQLLGEQQVSPKVRWHQTISESTTVSKSSTNK